jgi:hypothetical protein
MTGSVKDWPDSDLDAVDTAFADLTCDPDPLSLDLDQVPGWPASDADGDRLGGVVPLPALGRWLLAHPRAYDARDAVWRELIRRARLGGPEWVVAAAALAMPALRRSAGQLHAGWAGDAADLDNEILTGFLVALRDEVDADQPAPYASLCWAAFRAGHRARCRDGAEAVPVADLEQVVGPRTPHRPYGHPDLLVRRAVQLGIVDPDDEQAWIDLRLGHRAVEPIAARLGVEVDTLRRRLQRLDDRIVEALADGLLTEVASPRVRHDLARSARRRAHIRAARAAPAAA